MKKGKEYELLIEQIYRELQGDAVIKQDDYILGKDSNTERQLDLTIRYKLAGTEILLAIQAKDWKNKADIKVVDNFRSVIRDVRAHKGILICRTGFTKKAIEFAKKEGIEVYSAHSQINPNWRVRLNIPAIKTEDVFEINFSPRLPVIGGETITLAKEIQFMKDGEIIPHVNILTMGIENAYLNKSGKFHIIKVNHEGLYCNQANNEFREVHELNIEYRFLKTEIWTAEFQPTEYRAIVDHFSEKVTHTHIGLNDIMPLLLDFKQWDLIKNRKFDYKSPHVEVRSTYFNIYSSSNHSIQFNYRFNNLK